MKILIAEDDPHIARLVTFKLNKEGYEIDWVENGNEVLQKLAACTFDLIMLDVMMPIKDGLETLKEIRELEDHAAAPIIMMTAKSQERDVLEAMGSGATDYIVKPFDPQDLATRVKSILANSPT